MTEEKGGPSLESKPKEAEKKARVPRVRMSNSKPRKYRFTCRPLLLKYIFSECLFIFWIYYGKRGFVLCDKSHNHSDNRKHNGNNPISHSDFICRPADSFKMMVKRRNYKYFLAPKLF